MAFGPFCNCDKPGDMRYPHPSGCSSVEVAHDGKCWLCFNGHETRPRLCPRHGATCPVEVLLTNDRGLSKYVCRADCYQPGVAGELQGEGMDRETATRDWNYLVTHPERVAAHTSGV